MKTLIVVAMLLSVVPTLAIAQTMTWSELEEGASELEKISNNTEQPPKVVTAETIREIRRMEALIEKTVTADRQFRVYRALALQTPDCEVIPRPRSFIQFPTAEKKASIPAWLAKYYLKEIFRELMR